MAAQHLHQAKKPFGTRHTPDSPRASLVSSTTGFVANLIATGRVPALGALFASGVGKHGPNRQLTLLVLILSSTSLHTHHRVILNGAGGPHGLVAA